MQGYFIFSVKTPLLHRGYEILNKKAKNRYIEST